MDFFSDNTAAASPRVMAALAAANAGSASSYGKDDWTSRVEERFAAIFEREVAVFLVLTGTAANALALASIVRPWGQSSPMRRPMSSRTNAAPPNSSRTAPSSSTCPAWAPSCGRRP